ncbi:CotS family spore coat protein [Acetivibrio mesophilus]|uniref:CotS family spore coat protein n=1 Tax=Acetivibrio mesophilus TaxID=2487273 RepID=A0A4Q0I6H4_9FIRM|nr:CotS family spore coat protein [Acetivibrio mesophilus]ODM25078.1 spore coat protein [Clostridium sp. Bc-iso-3]RXE59920.1 CotS family spore coat protein [Acetivibrio mesophilus]
MNDITNNQNIDLYELASNVLKEYEIEPETINVIQSASIKTVWRLKTKDRELCLKRLKQTLDKARFSVNAQDFIYNCGGNVPGIIRDKKGNLIHSYNDQLFVVYEWLYGRDLAFGNPDDLKAALQGLAKFHIASKGYVSPEDARVSSKLNKWPEQYKSMADKLSSWKEVSREKPASGYLNAFLKYVDDIVDIGHQAIELLNASRYTELTANDSEAIVLCHQDYGKGNALLTDNGVYVIDLDGVTWDHPGRDLRKIIGKLAENRGSWSLDLIENILDWYSEINPLSPADKELIYIDLIYPHWFFGLVKNIFKNDKSVSPSKIEKIARLENSKIPLLTEKLRDIKSPN